MPQRFSPKAVCTLLLAGLLCAVLPVVEVQAKPPNDQQASQRQNQQTLTAAEAAHRAKAKHGGKVLKVSPKGKGYRGKLLKDSGRVLSVMIKD